MLAVLGNPAYRRLFTAQVLVALPDHMGLSSGILSASVAVFEDLGLKRRILSLILESDGAAAA